MIARNARNRVEDLLSRFPAVVLIGPRQVGKTTLALDLVEERGEGAVYLDLERPADLARLADPERYLETHKGRFVVLDEVHRTPGLFQVLRGTIDRRRRAGLRAGQFLLLGSASLDLLRQSSESLAGRMAIVELTPFLADEVVASASEGAPPHVSGDQSSSHDESARRTLDRLWVRGGFPESFLASDDLASIEWRHAFIRTYLERDIPILGPRIPAETLRRFWTMLAHEQGALLNASRLAGGLGVSGQTVARYLDLLVDLLLVRRLQPWASNVGKRLVRSPKVYVRDSGLVHALLELPTLDALLGHPVVGGSWEGFVVENLIDAAPARTQPWFYRTSSGAEIDLLLELPDGERWAIEVKHSSAPSVSKGFRFACDDVGATRRLVVYPGDDVFPLGGGVEAVGLLEAVRLLRERRH